MTAERKLASLRPKEFANMPERGLVWSDEAGLNREVLRIPVHWATA